MRSIPADARPRRPRPSSLPNAPRAALAGAALASAVAAAWAAPGADEPWRTETTVDASAPYGRHEAAAAAVDGKMYLLGGRKGDFGQRVDVYDPVADTWTALGPMPLELHHFQPVVIGTEIWVIGAFTGGYPDETPVPDVHVYDTAGATWRIAGEVPPERRRGSAAAALHGDGSVYLLGGNTRGHDGGAVAWFDRFDPVTGLWEALPDAPHARDHFGIAILGDRLVAAGGRTSVLPDPFANTVAATDVYSFASGAWAGGADIPTRRAGAFTVGFDGELIVVGGEISGRGEAFGVAEAFDADDGTWRELRPLNVGRHGGGAAVLGDRLHVVAGSDVLGGADLDTHESLGLDTDGPDDATDTDGDGLSDAAEAGLGTDPTVADTDGDTLDDGVEVGAGTNPLASDTDGDGLGDAEEADLGTDPTLADTDGGGANDGDEVGAGSDPLDAGDDGAGADGGADGDGGTGGGGAGEGGTEGGGADDGGTDGAGADDGGTDDDGADDGGTGGTDADDGATDDGGTGGSEGTGDGAPGDDGTDEGGADGTGGSGTDGTGTDGGDDADDGADGDGTADGGGGTGASGADTAGDAGAGRGDADGDGGATTAGTDPDVGASTGEGDGPGNADGSTDGATDGATDGVDAAPVRGGGGGASGLPGLALGVVWLTLRRRSGARGGRR